MRKKAIQAIAKDLNVKTPEEMVRKLGEESFFGDSSLSYCLGCGEQGPSLDPDAANVKCESCGRALVTGLDNLIMLLSMSHPDKINEMLNEEE